METIRLNKFLAERIGVSRREADDLIAAGQITVNDAPAALGARIDKSDKVCYNIKIIPFDADYLYLAFNKPVGYVCSRRAQGSAPTLYDLLPKKYRHLKTVGRLDKDSSGLILLTNDGDFAYQMTHPKFHKEKLYEVTLDRPLEPLHQQMISDYGVMLDDGPSRFTVLKDETDVSTNATDRTMAGGSGVSDAGGVLAESSEAGGASGRVPVEHPKGGAAGGKLATGPAPKTLAARYLAILREGRNRQVRRTFAALGYTVVKLHRTQFGPYSLTDLAPGEFVEFTKK